MGSWHLPGLVLELSKEMPVKKRKRKVAKAKSTLAATAPTTTQGAKVALTIKGPPKNTGTIP